MVLLHRTKRDTIETVMLWKGWGMLIFRTEPPPFFFPMYLVTAHSDTRMAQSWTGKKAEMNFKEGQSSIFFQAKHYRRIVKERLKGKSCLSQVSSEVQSAASPRLWPCLAGLYKAGLCTASCHCHIVLVKPS